MNRVAVLVCLGALGLHAPARAALAIRVVAAENFYGDVARQIGGDGVAVTSILANPDQDPHLFEAGASVARAVSAAQIVICNGLGYDPWMDSLITATSAPRRQVLVVAALTGRKPGDNPHIWYDPATMSALAAALAAEYATLDPAHAAGYADRLARFQASLAPIRARIAALRQKLHGTEVAATEPIFGYLFSALGLVSRNQAFQRDVMNDTEASASDVAAFEDDLRSHRVKLLLFNRQASNVVADRMSAVATKAGDPTLGATETEPLDTPYQVWLLGELDAVGKALGDGNGK